MSALHGQRLLMRVFLGESDRHGGRPLADVLVELFRRRGLAGATVLRGTQGFGATSRLHRDSILRLSQDLPLVIEVVDREEAIRDVLPELEGKMGGGLVTLERVEVIRYRPGGGPGEGPDGGDA